MKVSVTIGSRRLVVDVPDIPEHDPSIDGQPVPADLVQIRPGLYSLLAAGRSYEVVLDTTALPAGVAQDEIAVHLGGALLTMEVEDERRRVLAALQAERPGARGPAASTTLTAPMPGRVVAVPVAPGASVERGQPLVILEAMKMESALNAPHPGVVAEVLVTPGQTVQQRQPLVRLDRDD